MRIPCAGLQALPQPADLADRVAYARQICTDLACVAAPHIRMSAPLRHPNAGIHTHCALCAGQKLQLHPADGLHASACAPAVATSTANGWACAAGASASASHLPGAPPALPRRCRQRTQAQEIVIRIPPVSNLFLPIFSSLFVLSILTLHSLDLELCPASLSRESELADPQMPPFESFCILSGFAWCLHALFLTTHDTFFYSLALLTFIISCWHFFLCDYLLMLCAMYQLPDYI